MDSDLISQIEDNQVRIKCLVDIVDAVREWCFGDGVIAEITPEKLASAHGMFTCAVEALRDKIETQTELIGQIRLS